MNALTQTMNRVSSVLYSIALWGAVLAVLAMAFSASWQVIARYVLDAPPVWTEELARRAMVWAGMLGASCAFRKKADPTLFPELRDTTGCMGDVLAIIRAIGVIIFATPVIWYSLFGANMNMARGFLGRSLNRQAEMLDVPMIWFTAAVPLAFVIILIHMAADLMTRLTAGTHEPQTETTKQGT